MESLGFSNPSSVWSDSPTSAAVDTTSPDLPRTVADWRPGDIDEQLSGSDFRLGTLLTVLMVAVGIAIGAFWLYQRPAAEAMASTEAVRDNARQLESALDGLATFNATLPSIESAGDTSLLFVADVAARSLFESSGDLPDTASETRSSAAAASTATLDGIRLAGDSHSYLLAVLPILGVPELETDPSMIELDEAARSFGDWQLWFDDVRTALPDGVLPAVTEQLNVLSGDLTESLTGYVDSLRQDDAAAAAGVLASLSTRLDEIRDDLDSTMLETQSRVEQRILEAQAALKPLLNDPGN